MKYFKIRIGSPVYEEVYEYSTKRKKKIMKDECRKYFILRFKARLFLKEQITEVLEQVYSSLASITGCTEVINLDSFEWGESSVFDEDSYVFEGAYCVGKNFDDLKTQRTLLENKCKELETTLGAKLYPFIHCPEEIPEESCF